MSDFKIGDDVTSVIDGRVRMVFTVDATRGHMVCSGNYEAAIRVCRPWPPGDDEEARRCRDLDMCAWFDKWSRLSAEDAAAVAGIVKKYLRDLENEEQS